MRLNKLWMLSSITILCLAGCGDRPPATAEILDPGNPPPPAVTVQASAPTQSASRPPTTEPQPTAVPAAQPTLAVPTAEDTPAASPTPAPAAHAFVKMEVIPSGAATLDPAGDSIRFSSDFKISTGPDLFVILSGANNLALDFQSFSGAVTNSPILYLGPLASINGAQEYAIPAGTDLSQFTTVVIWCKTYSVAFAAAPLR